MRQELDCLADPFVHRFCFKLLFIFLLINNEQEGDSLFKAPKEVGIASAGFSSSSNPSIWIFMQYFNKRDSLIQNKPKSFCRKPSDEIKLNPSNRLHLHFNL
eukprot:NODE_244_length_13037_cov_0.560442.p10 type:complete len:102 gc:universal NODE_244_length_13037_cov_0.560442:2596-2291(-)